MATGYHRGGGQTTSGPSPVARPSTAASVVSGVSAGSKDWASLRAETGCPPSRSRPSRDADTHVLPTPVPVPTTTTNRSGRG